jgi:tetratricopeptide (TPR) repeat protein
MLAPFKRAAPFDMVLVAIAAAMVAWPAARAQAPSQQSWHDCFEGTGQTAVQGCTLIIQSSEDEQPRSDAHAVRGSAYIGLQNYTAALADLNAAVAMDSPHYATYFDRGIAQAHLGNLEAAIADWQQAQRMNPDDPDLQRYIDSTRQALAGGEPLEGADGVEIASCTGDFDAAFTALGNNSAPQARWGARANFQYSYYLGTQGLARLENHRNCMSDADYQGRRRQLEGMRDQGRNGCNQLSTAPGSCTAEYPTD